MLAVAASGATRLGPGYVFFAAAYLVLALVALRARDPARARAAGLASRHRATLALAIALTCALTFGLVRGILPLHDAVQRAIEQRFMMHDMVGFGAGSSLGEMRDMIQSEVEVLRVAPPPRSLPVDYLRGAVYDQYRSDGFWSESPFAERLHDVPVASDLAPLGTAVRIRRVAGTPGRYFLPLNGRDVRVVSGAIEADELGSTLTVGSDHVTEYTFVLGTREKLAPVPPRGIDLQIPRSEKDALTRLAHEWSAGVVADEDKLDAIIHRLNAEYRYSLAFLREADDPLLDFLFRGKLGYCTYFASALTMLARAEGIPARLVTGYRVAEWSPVAQEYVVREKNAHAWVEAWVNGAWRTYDPTPMQELSQDRRHLAAFTTLLADAMVRTERAVSYAVAHVTPAQLLVVLALLGAMWVSVRWLRKRGFAVTPTHEREGADRPLPYFAQLASSLERTGLSREGSEPLDEFVGRLEQSGLGEAARLVERYAALRYGGLGDPELLERDVLRFVRKRSSSGYQG
jgi:transglutaminase-like putative cysteine protease